MIAAVIRFTLPVGTDWDGMRELARQRASAYYRHVQGLRTKAFIVSPEERVYGGLYVWESRQALDAFLQSEAYLSAVQKLGQQPDIQVYDVAAYIEGGMVVDISVEVKAAR